MEPAFWIGLFGAIASVATAIAAHFKNASQDKEGHKRDLKINTLETELNVCQKERILILKQLTLLNAKKLAGQLKTRIEKRRKPKKKPRVGG